MYHFLITRDFLRTLWFNQSYTSTVTDMQIYRLCIVKITQRLKTPCNFNLSSDFDCHRRARIYACMRHTLFSLYLVFAKCSYTHFYVKYKKHFSTKNTIKSIYQTLNLCSPNVRFFNFLMHESRAQPT